MDNINNIALAEKVGQTLKSKKRLLSVAESCTGGGICQALTEIPGSSDWFDCGFVSYSNSSKAEMLDISAALIAEHGAVSEEIAAAMAAGALANSEANVAISTTGIAGPGGAVPGKPVGTVCFAWLIGGISYTERKVFSGDRHAVREQTIEHALTKLHRLLEEV
jgi:nicotinamide-nucleotide amidase